MVFEEEEKEMVAAQKGLVVVTEEEARRLNTPAQPSWRGRIIMAISKASESSVKINVSPATIALLVTLLLQTIAVVWWAQGVTKDIEVNKKTIMELQGEQGKQQMLINDYREKIIRLQTIVERVDRDNSIEKTINDRLEKGEKR